MGMQPWVERDKVRSDEELVALCRQGDGRAWEALIRRHQDRILNLAYQFTGNREEARDLAQEIFVRLYRKLNQYQEDRTFRTWFNSLARNLCIDRYRRAKRDRVVVGTPVEEFPHLAARTEPVDRRVIRREHKEMIMQALDTLSDISREAIVLRDLQEQSLDEIATVLRLPIGTVKSRIHRARIELARELLKLETVGTQPEGSNGL